MVSVKFNYFVRQLLTYYWQQILEARANGEDYEAWKAEQDAKQRAKDEDLAHLNLNIQDIIKKTVAK